MSARSEKMEGLLEELARLKDLDDRGGASSKSGTEAGSENGKSGAAKSANKSRRLQIRRRTECGKLHHPAACSLSCSEVIGECVCGRD